MFGPQMLFSGLRKFISRYYGHPAYQDVWRKLDGHAIQISINTFGSWILNIANGQLEINAQDLQDSTATEMAFKPTIALTGPLNAFLRLASTRDLPQAKQLGLCLTGDLTLALSLAQVFKNPPIDFTERLSGWLGDGVAHRLTQWGSGLYCHLKQSSQRIAAMSAEYLQEEALLLPTASEIEEWMTAVDTLRDDTERLAARIRLAFLTENPAHAE